MKTIIKILRYDKPEKRRYWQSFSYEAAEGESVASALRGLSRREGLTDIQGNAAKHIKWECGCLQKKCGACAMLINGYPALACDTELAGGRSTVELAPLSKFPVVEDLVVDRGVIFENLKKMQIWFDEKADILSQDTERAFDASSCLKCGCCLELCMSFRPDEAFMGNLAMLAMARLVAQLPESQKKRTLGAYKKHVYDGCDRYNACHQICPAGIDTAGLMSHCDALACSIH